MIQNQIGILPSKYCTATSDANPAALTMIDRRSGTRRYDTAIYNHARILQRFLQEHLD